jgi:16S rRNA (guanine966-N2)-methyltransferase
MRVIAGSARRIVLKAPEGMHTRPTTDRIKETLFNMIGPKLPQTVFVDLFSGSGGIGIEALSRGSRQAYFVENDNKALSCIRENLLKTRLQERGEILAMDVKRAVTQLINRGICADIVFMDPPYNQLLEKELLELLAPSTLIGEDTLIIVEASKDTDFGYVSRLGLSIQKEKLYGSNKHVFLVRQ